MSGSFLGPGAVLDRYVIVRPVAQGGMGAVWLARLRGRYGVEQLVAIKTILPEYARETRFRQLFLEEARLASRIRHPNVAQVIELGEYDDILYLVMEWVDGASLEVLVGALGARRVPLPLPIALRIVSDACLGAHAAHELRDEQGALLGVVHRDISPQNILVADSGATKLVDLGIARARAGLEEEAKERIVRGKLAYMAPEQAEGKVVDRRADVWSLGAVLFALVTGRPLLVSREQMASLIAERRSAATDAAPRDVRQILETSLVVDPRARAATALELHRRIEELLAREGPATTADVARFIALHLPRTVTFTEIAERPPSLPEAAATAAEPAVERARACVATQPTEEVFLVGSVAGIGDAVMDVLARDGVRVSDGIGAPRAAATVLDATRESVARTLATRGDARLPTLLLAADAQAGEARAAFNNGAVDAYVVLPAARGAVLGGVKAAVARVARHASASARPDVLAATEEQLRLDIDELAERLDHARRARAAATNDARLAIIGEIEARRADALGRPLSLVVYRTARAAYATPTAEAARLLAILHPTAVVSEELGEWVAVVPEQSKPDLCARVATLGGTVGAAAVGAHARGESFMTLLATTRAELEP